MYNTWEKASSSRADWESTAAQGANTNIRTILRASRGHRSAFSEGHDLAGTLVAMWSG